MFVRFLVRLLGNKRVWYRDVDKSPKVMPFERLKTYVSNEVCSGRLDKNAAAARGEVSADVIPSKSVRFGVEVRLLGRAPHVLGATV